MKRLLRFLSRFDCNHYWHVNQRHGEPCWVCGTPYRDMRQVDFKDYEFARKHPYRYYTRSKDAAP